MSAERLAGVDVAKSTNSMLSRRSNTDMKGENLVKVSPTQPFKTISDPKEQMSPISNQ